MATITSIEAGDSVAAAPAPALAERPCLDHIVTEDDTPVDNMFSEKQQRLLTEPLYSSWDAGRPFVATANVGLFYAVRQPPLVPDVLVSLDVEAPEELMAKEHRSYFVWEYGKTPEAVVEVVSNTEGGETTDKKVKYAQIGIVYYAIYDPAGEVQSEPLQVFVLREKSYVPCSPEWLPVLGLGLTLWRGPYENRDAVWLRWCDRQGRVIPTGAESAEQERTRTEQERTHAEQERTPALTKSTSVPSTSEFGRTDSHRGCESWASIPTRDDGWAKSTPGGRPVSAQKLRRGLASRFRSRAARAEGDKARRAGSGQTRVRIATSGGQKSRTGGVTVPTPRLTKTWQTGPSTSP